MDSGAAMSSRFTIHGVSRFRCRWIMDDGRCLGPWVRVPDPSLSEEQMGATWVEGARSKPPRGGGVEGEAQRGPTGEGRGEEWTDGASPGDRWVPIRLIKALGFCRGFVSCMGFHIGGALE